MSKSRLGYSKNSPYRNSPFLDIHTPNGTIDMSNTDKNLLGITPDGEMQFLQAGAREPYLFNSKLVREIPIKQFGGMNNNQSSGRLQSLVKYLFEDDPKGPEPTGPSVKEANVEEKQPTRDEYLDQLENDNLAMSVATNPIYLQERKARTASAGNVGNKAQYAYNYFKSRGLQEHQAAGIVANLIQESGNFRDDVISGDVTGDNNLQDKAYGIAQWRGARKQGLIDFANKRNMNPFSLDAQLQYVEAEAKQRGDWQKVMGAKDLNEATHLFNYNYEVSADSRNPSLKYFRTKHVLDKNGKLIFE